MFAVFDSCPQIGCRVWSASLGLVIPALSILIFQVERMFTWLSSRKSHKNSWLL